MCDTWSTEQGCAGYDSLCRWDNGACIPADAPYTAEDVIPDNNAANEGWTPEQLMAIILCGALFCGVVSVLYPRMTGKTK